MCKERRGVMKTTKEFWSKKQFTDSSSMEQWLLARQRVGELTFLRGTVLKILLSDITFISSPKIGSSSKQSR